MKETIVIGPGTEINLWDLVQSRLLIQGNSGSGKSGVARVIIEKAFGIIPFVVWDIEGEYYTLKELSGDIIIIGGQHADVPLTMELAEKLPAFIIKNGLHIVVDLSDLKMHQRIAFTKDFYETLMDLPMEYWTSYFFFLEECHKLAGEQDKQESATSIKDLMQRGRKRGFCGIPITQRISMLNKSVAAECNNKFIGRTNLDLDMDRSAKELGFSKAADRLKLRDLPKKHFYAYGTSIAPQHVHEIVIEDAKTTMPKQGMKLNFKPEKPTPKLLEMLAKLNDVPKSKVATTKEESSDLLEDQQLIEARQIIQRMEISLQEAERIQLAYAKTAVARGVLLTNIKNLIIDYENKEQTDRVDTSPAIYAETNYATAPDTRQSPREKTISKAAKSSTGADLQSGEQSILIAIRQYQATGGLRRDQLCVITGYKRSSVNTYLQRLHQKKLVQESAGKFSATQLGIAALDKNYQPLPKGRELQQYWLNSLPEGERKIFEVCLKFGGQEVSREQLEKSTGYKRSSVNTYLQRLSAREVITSAKGGATPSNFLFQ